MDRRKTVAAIAAGAALLGIAGRLATQQARRRFDQTYRIGWQVDPPFQVKGDNGSATGFSIELVRAAARRRGIRLEWLPQPTGPEESLRSGQVDLWPVMTSTPERKRFLHITDPYMHHDHCLVVRASNSYSEVQDFARARVAAFVLPITTRLARRALPQAQILPAPSTREAIESVCEGRADAAFVEEFGGFSALLAGGACIGHPLRLIWIPNAQTELGIGATFPSAPVADALREEIGAMARQGELSAIMTRWGYYSPQSLQTMNALLNARRMTRTLVAGTVVIALLFIVAAFTANHIRRQRNHIRRIVAGREHVQKLRREWERRFRILLESGQFLAIMIDRSGSISFCNAYTLSLTGWDAEDLMGHPAEEVLDCSYLRQLAEAAQTPAGRGSLPLAEGTILTASGERRWIRWTSTVLHDHDGHAAGYASLGEDVTDLRRLRAEQVMRESEERFRAIFQHAAIGVAQVSLDGRILLANRQYQTIVGYSADELTGKSPRELTHPDDYGPQTQQIPRLLSGEISCFTIEKRYVRKDGSVAWARLNESLVRDHDNRPKHFISVAEDITERKQAEAALRESEARFRNMADTAPVMIWVSDLDKRCTFFNKGWLTFTGQPMDHELGNGWMEGIHRDDRDRCSHTYLSAFDGRQPFQVEYRLRHHDGRYRWIRCEGVPRFGPDGAFAGYIGSCIDIHDSKRAHEEALARQKLESVGVLAGGIAHDFNNLLGSIMTEAELALADLPVNSRTRESVARINDVALHAAEIVRQLLAYAGKEKPVFELVDVSALVREMLQLLAVSISKQAVLNVNLPRALPAVRANAAQIRQVVMNLLMNASEALGPNGGAITVATDRLGDQVRLEVTDTGCGMTEEVRARIFDPYFTTKFAGRGLGLAAVQGIIRRHQGAINIVSAPGRGTRCEVLLPASRQMARETPTAAVHVGNAAAAPAGGTILIVEDEISLRTPVATMLRRNGYCVIEAGNGGSAIEIVRERAGGIDAILLDMTLPDVSGADILPELRRMQPGVRVILTTAYSQEMVRTALGGLQPWSFIRKPYRTAELIALLQRTCIQSSESESAGICGIPEAGLPAIRAVSSDGL